MRLLTVVALAAVMLVAGCGKKTPSADEQYECQQHAINLARYYVVRGFFEKGKLGTAARVNRESIAMATGQPGIDPKSFMTARGSIIPYSKMDDREKDTFLMWANSQRVEDITDGYLRDAIDAAHARSAGFCAKPR